MEYLIIAAIIALIYYLRKCCNEEKRKEWATIANTVGVAAGVLALYFVGMQIRQTNENTKLAYENSELEYRPYLYLELRNARNWWNDREKMWFGGGDLYFINKGKNPATIIGQPQYKAETELQGEISLKKYFDEALGGFPDVSVVFPGQEIMVPFHPNTGGISSRARYFRAGAVVAYRGPKEDQIYWYKFSRIYYFKDKPLKYGRKIVLNYYEVGLTKPDIDWDKNDGTSKIPKLEDSNWEKVKMTLNAKEMEK